MWKLLKDKYDSIKYQNELNKQNLIQQIEESKQKEKFDKIDYEFAVKQREEAIRILDTIKTEATNNQVNDSDLSSGWMLHGARSGQLTKEDHERFLLNAYNLYQTNPHARTIVRNLVKFVLGVGPTIVPKDEKIKKRLLKSGKLSKSIISLIPVKKRLVSDYLGMAKYLSVFIKIKKMVKLLYDLLDQH